jgi:hypothetical protein
MRFLKLFILFLIVLLGCKTEDPKNLITSPTQNLPLNPLKDNITKVVEVKSKTGRIWMDRNLGASQVATSSSDEKAYGDLYQWGRGTDGHQLRTSDTTSKLSSKDVPGNALFIITQIITQSPPNTTQINPYQDWRKPQNDNLWQGVNGVNNPCPAGFRLPTELEWYAEQQSWLGGINSEGAINSPLKLPLAGSRNSLIGQFIPKINELGAGGYYWSSTIATRFFEPFLQISLFMYVSTSNPRFDNSGNRIINASDRGGGKSVRCIKD